MPVISNVERLFSPYGTTLFPKVVLNGKSRFKEKGIRGLILVFFLILPTYPFYFFLPKSLILSPNYLSIGITFFAWEKDLNEIYTVWK